MMVEELAEVLSRVVADAEDAGLSRDVIAAELVAMAKAMRLCLNE
jgi:1,6-anhydro-N-acetylmuramate kinase